MKKLFSIILCTGFLLLSILPAGAYNIEADIQESFSPYADTLFITEETKAGDIKYFGERITFYDSQGNELSADDYLKTGDSLVYFDILALYTVVLVGDCNCDGKITASDARIALRMSANLYKYSELPETHGAWDADFSQTIEAADARSILRVSAGLDTFDDFKNAYNEAVEKHSDKTAEFDDKLIMICLNPDYVKNEDVYTPEFYGSLVGSVEVFAEYSENDVWIKLYLAEPSKENVDMLINECFENEAIIVAEKNYIWYLDFVTG